MANPHCEKRILEARAFVKSVHGAEGFRDVSEWAVTGSVARGDASAGSDIELVALVPKARHSEQLVFQDELLTVFFLSLEQLNEPRFLASIDAEHFIILEGKALGGVQQNAQASLTSMLNESKDHCQKQLWVIEESLKSVDAGSYEALAAHHKRAQTILWWAGLKLGLRRVQKIRHHRQVFGDEVAELYLRAINLEGDARVLQSAMMSHWPQLLAQRGNAGRPSTLKFKHTTMSQKWRGEEFEDGVLAARDFFEVSVRKTPPALASFKLALFTEIDADFDALSDENTRRQIRNACTKSADAQYELFEFVK